MFLSHSPVAASAQPRGFISFATLWGGLALALACLTVLVEAMVTDAGPALVIAAALVTLGGVVAICALVRGGIHSLAAAYAVFLWLFHWGLLVPVSFGWTPAPRWLQGAPIDQVLLCIVLAFSALAAGAMLGNSGRVAPRRPRGDEPHLFTVTVAATAAIAALAIWDLSRLGITRILTESYNSALYRESDLRLYKSALGLAGPMLLIMLASARGTAQRRLASIAGLVLVAFLLFVGDRSNAIFFIASALFILNAAGVQVRRSVLVGAVLALVVAGSAVRAIREFDVSSRETPTWAEQFRDSGPLAAIVEMGTTVRPLLETLDLVPRSFGFRYGSSYIFAAATALPNLGATVREVSGNAAELPPALWVTAVTEPATYQLGGGLGFSAIAEPYLNFGYAGVLVWFIALGYLLAKCDATTDASSAWNLAFRALLLTAIVTTTRNDMTNFVRPILWPVAAVFIASRVIGVLTFRKRVTAVRLRTQHV
jgi:hypothetical protein